MSVKFRLLFLVLNLLPCCAMGQRIEGSLGVGAFRFINSPDGHETNLASGSYGWDIELRLKEFRKEGLKGCIGIQMYSLKTNFYYNYWAGGGAYSKTIEGDLNAVYLGFSWFPINLAKNKSVVDWRVGTAIHFPVFTSVIGQFHEHDYYSIPRYNIDREISANEKSEVIAPITIHFLSTLDFELFQSKKFNLKIRFKASINSLFEVLSIGNYRGSVGLVASKPISN